MPEKVRMKKRNNLKRNIIIVLYVLSFITGGAVSYLIYGARPAQTEFDVVTYEKVVRLASLSEAYASPVSEVTMTAVGDVMVHKAQLDRAYRDGSDSFDFTDTFAYVKEILGEKDYTVANLETTLAGRDNGVGTKYYGYNDYPMFNSPEVLADTLKDCGVDFLSTVNNHSMDSRIYGVYATLDYLDKLGFAHTGTARTQEEKDELCLKTVNGINFGFCAFTYDTNGINVPEESDFAVNTLKNYANDRVEWVCQRIRDLRTAGADFVIVIAHWGIEYQTKPSSYQTDLTDNFFNAGADVIFGSHPHVVQPMEIREITNPDGTKRTGVCIYSMGNFVSSQTNKAGPDKDLGLIMNVTFKKENNVCSIEAVEVTPTYVYWTDDIIGVVPVEYAVMDPSAYPLIDSKGWTRISYAHDKIISVVSGLYGVGYELEDGWYRMKLPEK